MKIYFSASIAGGRKYLDIYKKLVAFMKEKGHVVLSEHIIRDNIFGHEEKWAPKNVFEQDIQWLDKCDIVIAVQSFAGCGLRNLLRTDHRQKSPVRLSKRFVYQQDDYWQHSKKFDVV